MIKGSNKLFVFTIILCSCISAPNSNYTFVERVFNNPDSLLTILKDSIAVKTKTDYYQRFTEPIFINADIQRIKELNSEGYMITRDIVLRVLDDGKFTGVLKHQICLKGKKSGLLFIIEFDNSEDGVWKLDYISRELYPNSNTN